MKFKVGDKVEVIEDYIPFFKKGEICEVFKVTPEYVVVLSDYPTYEDGNWAIDYGRIRLVSRKPEDSQESVDSSVQEPSNNPQHYGGDWRTDDFIAEMKLPFREGNIVKYVVRHKKKNGLEDLKKARNYLDRLIEKWEG